MTTQASHRATLLPEGWTEHVRSALLHAISLATMALAVARSRAATSRSSRRRLRAELDRAHTEIALLKEELDIKNDRWSRLASRRRPHYTPIQRMRILHLEAARGWLISDNWISRKGIIVDAGQLVALASSAGLSRGRADSAILGAASR